MIVIGNRSYEVLEDHRNGWNPEAFRDRYSEVLERYDYIVGDWGYNQLRLKGFYRDNHPKAAKDVIYSTMSDYINEYCNFGCAYFVLQKSKEIKDPKELKELKEQELKEQELRAEREALENGQEEENADSDSIETEARKLSKDHRSSGRSNETLSDKEAPEPRGRREGREGREARESRSSKSSKPWKEAKQRENRENKEIREHKDTRPNVVKNHQQVE